MPMSFIVPEVLLVSAMLLAIVRDVKGKIKVSGITVALSDAQNG